MLDKVDIVVSKLNLMGCKVIYFNTWAVVFISKGKYGYYDVSVGRYVAPTYVDIMLLDYFILCRPSEDINKYEVYIPGGTRDIAYRQKTFVLAAITDGSYPVIACVSNQIHYLYLINKLGKIKKVPLHIPINNLSIDRDDSGLYCINRLGYNVDDSANNLERVIAFDENLNIIC